MKSCHTNASSKIAAAVEAARRELANGKVDRAVLVALYSRYVDVGDTKRFISRAARLFPKLNCGVASVYLQYLLGGGTVVWGKYGLNDHTFLLLDEDIIVDITADQYGGPEIYIGPLCDPWSFDTIALHVTSCSFQHWMLCSKEQSLRMLAADI